MATPGGLGASIAVPASQCIYRVVTPGQAIDLDETELVRRIPLHPLKLPEWGCWPARLSGLWTRSRRRPAATVAAVARLAETDRSVHRPGDLGEVVGIVGADIGRTPSRSSVRRWAAPGPARPGPPAVDSRA